MQIEKPILQQQWLRKSLYQNRKQKQHSANHTHTIEKTIKMQQCSKPQYSKEMHICNLVHENASAHEN